MKFRSLIILPVALLPALLTGCGPTTVREYNAARWVKPDTTLVYLFHHFQVDGGGGSIGRPAYNTYPYSRIRLYHVSVGAEGYGFHGQTLLYKNDNAVPCGELVYRPWDSLVFFSYREADGYNGRWRHGCSATDTLKRLVAGKLVNGDLWPLVGKVLDTAGFFEELTGAQLTRGIADSGISIVDEYETLCAKGVCIQSNPGRQ